MDDPPKYLDENEHVAPWYNEPCSNVYARRHDDRMEVQAITRYLFVD